MHIAKAALYTLTAFAAIGVITVFILAIWS
jgi:hypothetical protein